ncbi:MAG: hypothetical protein IPJ11_08765 [Gemmatimonadetes bacterium]|nr:hypothetical protein [Gemmatimonadota bacterium]
MWATLPAPKPPYRYPANEVRKRFWAELTAAREGSQRWARDYWLGLTDIDGVPYYPPFGWHCVWRPSAEAEERHRIELAWRTAARRYNAEVAAGLIDASAPTPFDRCLHPASTARVAIPSRSRARWLIERALADHLPDLHTWDPHEVLVRGVAARPNGSLLAMIHAANPDGVFHGLNDPPRRRPGAAVGLVATSYLGRAPSSVIKRCCREAFDGLPLTDPTVALLAMAVALELVHQWRTGRLQRSNINAISDRIATMQAIVREIDYRMLGLSD